MQLEKALAQADVESAQAVQALAATEATVATQCIVIDGLEARLS